MKAVFRTSIPRFVCVVALGMAVCLAVTTRIAAQPSCAVSPSGLVSWWRGEGDALDSIGSNHGTLMNGASFTPGMVGQAFSFNGTNNYVQVLASASLNLSNEITLECWYKDSGTSGWYGLMAKRGAEPAPANFGMHVNPNGSQGVEVYFLEKNVGQFRVSDYLPVPSVGVFHHVAATFKQVDATNVELKTFVDGQCVKVAVVSGNLANAVNNEAMTLGAEKGVNGVSSFFRGVIDEPGIYNRALSTNEIQAIYNAGSAGKCPTAPTGCVPAPDNRVSWWRGEGNPFDQLGVNDGVPVNNVAFTNGRVGQGFLFNGVDSFVRIPHHPSLNFRSALTVELWFQDLGSTDQYYGLIAKRDRANDSGPINFGINVDKTGPFGFQLYFNDPTVATGHEHETSDYLPVPAAGVFHHLAATFRQVNATNVEMGTFIDGQFVRAQVVLANLSNAVNDVAVTIGASTPTGGEFFKGIIDEVSLYNRVLSTNEIQAIYNAGSTGTCVVTVAPVITTQPTNQTLPVGGTANFGVAATGTSPLSYQWRLNGTNLAGATTKLLTLSEVQLANEGTYSVVISNSAGIATSSNAVLTVYLPSCTNLSSGLVSWWRADSNALDATGVNNGVLSNGVTFAPGRVGQGFNFNGSNSFVQVANSASLSLSNDFTVELWFKENGSPTTAGLIAKRPASGACNFGINLIPSGAGVLQVYFLDPVASGNFRLSAYSPLPPAGVFHHLAARFRQVTSNQVEITTFIDGQGVKSDTFTAVLARAVNTVPVTIGTTIPLRNGELFKGVIDEPSIYNRALSTNEIQAIYNAGSAGKCAVAVPPLITSNPTNQTVTAGDDAAFRVVATGTPPLTYQWRFNGTNIAGATATAFALANAQPANAGGYSVVVSNSASTATSSNAVLTVNPPPPCVPPVSGLVSWWRGESNALDSVGSNHGTLMNGATFTPGKVGQTFSFHGTSSYVQVPTSASLNLSNEITLECWYKDLGTPGWYGLIAKRGAEPAPANFGLHINPTGPQGIEVYFLEKNVGQFRVSNYLPVPTAGVFHHVAATFKQVDASHVELKTFINGQCVKVTVVLGNLANTLNNEAVTIGAEKGVNGVSSFFRGVIDEPTIYNRALSTNEILAIYSGGSSGKCPEPPVIVIQPVSQRVTVGDNANFSVVATGSPQLRYQWRFNGDNLAGGTSSTLSFTVSDASGGLYSVRVTNAFGSIISSNALLVVNHPPVADPSATMPLVISLNNTNATVVLDGSRSSDSDGDPLHYYWLVAGAANPLATGIVAVVTLPVGSNVLTLTVDDGLATGSQTFGVEVITPAQAVERLVALVESGAARPQPLIATLSAALAAIDRSNPTAAINQLMAFQNKVRAQVSPLDPELAETFIQLAQEIIDALSGGAGKAQGKITQVLREADGKTRLKGEAASGARYIIEASSNMVNWERIGVATDNGADAFEFEDAQSAPMPARFYRIVSP